MVIVIQLIVLMEFVALLLVMATAIDVMLQVQKEHVQIRIQIALVIVMFVHQVIAPVSLLCVPGPALSVPVQVQHIAVHLLLMV